MRTVLFGLLVLVFGLALYAQFRGTLAQTIHALATPSTAKGATP